MAAAALANARTFGGEDYVGFHTMMALAPAFHMAPRAARGPPGPAGAQGALPQHQPDPGVRRPRARRSCTRSSPLKPLPDGHDPAARPSATPCAPRTWTGPRPPSPSLAAGAADEAFNDLLLAVQDNTEVHRTVLPYRAWDLLGLIGQEQAQTLLRQSVRYCVKSERDWQHTREIDRPRELLPRLLDQYKLPEGSPGPHARPTTPGSTG